jgi:hypothetical protein
MLQTERWALKDPERWAWLKKFDKDVGSWKELYDE